MTVCLIVKQIWSRRNQIRDTLYSQTRVTRHIFSCCISKDFRRWFGLKVKNNHFEPMTKPARAIKLIETELSPAPRCRTGPRGDRRICCSELHACALNSLTGHFCAGPQKWPAIFYECMLTYIHTYRKYDKMILVWRKWSTSSQTKWV